jgi:transposase-like protein
MPRSGHTSPQVHRPLPGSRKKQYQYTAIDDCTRIRVLRIYDRHNQKTAIQFIDYVLEKLPFNVEVIQTDNGCCPTRSLRMAATCWLRCDRGAQCLCDRWLIHSAVVTSGRPTSNSHTRVGSHSHRGSRFRRRRTPSDSQNPLTARAPEPTRPRPQQPRP